MPKGSNDSSIKINNVKGLLVGINYRGTNNQLGGCINDVLSVKQLIESTYPTAHLELLTDDTAQKPTRKNILDKLNALVANARPGDTLIFDYSGHGSQVEDIHGDETDGLDETICPIDFMTTRIVEYKGKKFVMDSQITDDEIKEIISKIPHGARLLMLSDSCHSGTIGDLKNDFTIYQGPNVWANEQCSSNPSFNNNNSVLSCLSSCAPNNNVAQSVYGTNYSEIHELFTVEVMASWVYLKSYNELRILPAITSTSLAEGFGGKKFIIPVRNNESIIKDLVYYPNVAKTLKTTFTKLSNGEYRASAPELRINNLNIQSPKNLEDHKKNWFSELLTNESTCQVTSHYDPLTGKHHHFNHGTGKKRTLNMRSNKSSCHGGELRIISGCREQETSADTGRNGACTMAFLNTINYLGGLENFLQKVFSHNVSDFKLVENTINGFLSKFGFKQYSVFSWDHAHSNKASRTLESPRDIIPNQELIASELEQNINMPELIKEDINKIENTPILFRYSVTKEQVQDYVANAIATIKSDLLMPATNSSFNTKEKVIPEFRKARNMTQ